MASHAEVGRHRPEQPVEDGTGRSARAPSQIPGRGWWAVLKRVWYQTGADNLGMIAAGCAFYAMLALFPAISVLISLYGLVTDPAAVESQVAAMQGVLPQEAQTLIAERAKELASQGETKLGWGLALGLGFALWTAMAGTKAIMEALNIAYEEKEKRGFFWYNLVAFAFTLSAIVGIGLALTVIVGLPAIVSLDFLGSFAAIVLRVVSWTLLAGFLVTGLAALYRWGPSREEAKWRWISPGAIVVAVCWVLGSAAFSFYVANFASYNATYGSLATVAIMLLWLWLSAYLVLLGAELNAELELQTAADTTTGPDRPMGQREAFTADHVAPVSERS